MGQIVICHKNISAIPRSTNPKYRPTTTTATANNTNKDTRNQIPDGPTWATLANPHVCTHITYILFVVYESLVRIREQAIYPSTYLRYPDGPRNSLFPELLFHEPMLPRYTE